MWNARLNGAIDNGIKAVDPCQDTGGVLPYEAPDEATRDQVFHRKFVSTKRGKIPDSAGHIGRVSYHCDGSLATVTLDSPALDDRPDSATAEGLREVCRAIAQDDSIRLVVVTGRGGVFAVGRQALPERRTDLGPDGALTWIHRHQVAAAVAELPVPVIAAVNGDALDQGLELALAADLRIASVDARFGFSSLGQENIPWDGGTQRLPRLIGSAWATDMMLTGRTVHAQQALEIGLVNRVVGPDRLVEETHALAEKILAGAPVAARYAKEAVQKGLDLSLDQGLRLEADLNILLHSTSDRAEGLQSFSEHRDPKFTGQ